jgi:cytochrome P450
VFLDNLQFSTSYAVHKVRRKAFDPYFSKTAVTKLEDVIVSCVKDFCHWLHEARKSGTPAEISVLARCLTSDVVTEYLFAKPYGFLQDPKKSEIFFAANNTVFKSLFMFRESVVVNRMVNAMQ